MLVKSNCRAPFLGLPEGNCDFLKGITLFRYSPFLSYMAFSLVKTQISSLLGYFDFEFLVRSDNKGLRR